MGFECYSIGDLSLDAGTQEVKRESEVVAIPRLSFLLLLSLARNAPNVVPVEQLEKEVWSGLVVDRGTVNKRVLLLRKVLGEDKGHGPYIAVVRGVGYRMSVDVSRSDRESNAAGPAAEPTQGWYQRSSQTIRATSYWLLGIVAVLALYQWTRESRVGSIPPDALARQATQAPDQPVVYSQSAIAVLPFVDLSEEKRHQFLGDGIAEEVINLIAGLDGLQVVARTSSFAFRDSQLTVMEISEQLKVGVVLEGSIRHVGDEIRVTAQLIDARNGYHIWSKNYDTPYEDIFSVQDDIASNIAESLKLTIDEAEKPDSKEATTSDINAFTEYLRGRELLNDRISQQGKGLREALGYFWKAVELDPQFARAHAGIAASYWLLPTYDLTLTREDYYVQAQDSANYALNIDPESTEALGVLAGIKSTRGHYAEASAIFQRIHSMGNVDSNIIHWYSQLLIRLGYFESVVTGLTLAYDRDPLNRLLALSLGSALSLSGRSEQAADVLNGIEGFAFRDYVLGIASINNRDFELARELFRGLKLRSDVLPAKYADWMIDAIEFPDRKEQVEQAIMAAVESGGLDNKVGFEILLIIGSDLIFDIGTDRAVEIDNQEIYATMWNPWSTALRRDPRFKAWLQDIGYVDYWRKYQWPDRCKPTGLDDFECM